LSKPVLSGDEGGVSQVRSCFYKQKAPARTRRTGADDGSACPAAYFILPRKITIAAPCDCLKLS
jgi:hypothetical protein